MRDNTVTESERVIFIDVANPGDNWIKYKEIEKRTRL